MPARVTPTVWIAFGLLIARGLLSQMDVPTRSSYVMAVVHPEERPAAASVTEVPRSLASAVAPLLSGWLLTVTPFGWPLVLAGAMKAAYDLVLLNQFSSIKPSAVSVRLASSQKTKPVRCICCAQSNSCAKS